MSLRQSLTGWSFLLGVLVGLYQLVIEFRRDWKGTSQGVLKFACYLGVLSLLLCGFLLVLDGLKDNKTHALLAVLGQCSYCQISGEKSLTGIHSRDDPLPTKTKRKALDAPTAATAETQNQQSNRE